MKMPFGKAALLIGAAAMLAPAGIAAQEVRDLDSERSDVLTFEGEVTTAPVLFQYTIEPGNSLLIDVVPAIDSNLDPVLLVTDVATGEILAEDDDGGEGLASRARIYSENGQRVEISVAAFAFFSEDESAGAFELQLRSSEYIPQQMQAVTFGSERSGDLPMGDSHLFYLSGEEGQMLEVALLANDDTLDPLLTLYKGMGTEGEELLVNDDGGEGLNSLLRYVLPESGTYTIAAQAYSEGYGSYTMRVAPAREHMVQSPQQVIALGERVSGYIGAGYENGGIDPSDITYQLTAETIAALRSSGGEMSIRMTAPLIDDQDFPSGIDPYLEVGFETPLGFASILTDDDGGEGLNSHIVINLTPFANEGDWLERMRIRASAIGSGGAYELELTEGAE